jgi:hypothetical protein
MAGAAVAVRVRRYLRLGSTDAATRTQQWLKHDCEYRVKLDDDFRQLGETFLEQSGRQRVDAFLPNVVAMPDLVSRSRAADEAWAERLAELDGHVPADNRSFRRLYPLIYRNGSRFTHPSSHVVGVFVSGNLPELVIGGERPLDRDLPLIGSAVLAAGLVIAVAGTPELKDHGRRDLRDAVRARRLIDAEVAPHPWASALRLASMSSVERLLDRVDAYTIVEQMDIRFEGERSGLVP